MLEEPGWLEDTQVLLPVPGWLEVVLVLLEVVGGWCECCHTVKMSLSQLC